MERRCDSVFNNAHIQLNTILIELWMLFVHTLHGQYDNPQGSGDVCGNGKWPLRTDGKDSNSNT